jgi:ATP-dependent helicase/nuclease subunit A
MALPQGGVAWVRGAKATPACLRPVIDAARASDAAERGRLLYVAMTRAESWLVVAAAGDTAGDCWHADVAAGLAAAGAETLADGTLRLSHGRWPDPVGAAAASAPVAVALPDWTTTPAAPASRLPRPVAPSALPGPKALPSEAGADTDLALPYGAAVHRMLEWLPRLPVDGWPAGAAAAAVGLPDPRAAVAEAMAVLQNQALAPVFAPETLAEVPLCATVAGVPMVGTADRLIVADGVVTCIDFKTNRAVPDRAEDIPAGVLAQLGAYAAMLAQIFPGHAVEVAVLWTATARLMPVPPAILRAALLAATTN